MEPSKRIVVNTLAQHIRSIVNICLSLYSTRLILQALGQSDYGIYSLVAGVVAMLGFLTNAMVVTTQRQLSFYHASGNIDIVRRMFSNSLLLHILLGFLLVAVLMAVEPFLFNGFLRIEQERMNTASVVYYLVILSLLITFLTAPYRALFIARENIVYISIIDVFDGIIKLLAAIWLLHCPYDRLIAYSWIIAGIMFFNLTALIAWAFPRFEECVLIPKISSFNWQSIKELTDFAGWSVYSMGCIIGRTQGTAFILNHFFLGTVVNAAWGIAQQVYGAISFIGQSVVNAVSPQLIKAEGAGNRQRMILLSELLSKYAFLLLSLIIIPLAFEMPVILSLWLGNVPEHSVLLCRFILITALCDQTTIGLGIANQAIGRIRNYSLTINTIKVLTLPTLWIIFASGKSIVLAMWCYLVFECICALARLPFLKFTAGISIRHFTKHVFGRILLPACVQVFVCWLFTRYASLSYRFLFTIMCSILITAVVMWFAALEPTERSAAKKFITNSHYE